MHVSDNRIISSRGDQSGILLGDGLLVDFPCFGNHWNRGSFVGDERAMVFLTGRVFLFFFLDDQGDFRAERASA